MTTRHSHRMGSKPELNLPPAAIRGLRKMGFGTALRTLKGALRGETTSESRAVVRLCRQLGAKFDSANPKLDGKLVGSVVVRLVDSVEYAKDLSDRLREITRIKGPSKREQLRSILMLIEEVEVRALRRQVEGLRREIPRLLKELEQYKEPQTNAKNAYVCATPLQRWLPARVCLRSDTKYDGEICTAARADREQRTDC
jgi:hypothetical protein